MPAEENYSFDKIFSSLTEDKCATVRWWGHLEFTLQSHVCGCNLEKALVQTSSSRQKGLRAVSSLFKGCVAWDSVVGFADWICCDVVSWVRRILIVTIVHDPKTIALVNEAQSPFWDRVLWGGVQSNFSAILVIFSFNCFISAWVQLLKFVSRLPDYFIILPLAFQGYLESHRV